MTKWILSNALWKDAVGVTKKPKRLNLVSHNGLVICPVDVVKVSFTEVIVVVVNVFLKRGWYYYFEEKPNIAKVFSEFSTNNYQIPK